MVGPTGPNRTPDPQFVTAGNPGDVLQRLQAPASYREQLNRALRDPVGYGGTERITKLLDFMSDEFCTLGGAVTSQAVTFDEACSVAGFLQHVSLTVQRSYYAQKTIVGAHLARKFVSPDSRTEQLILTPELLTNLPRSGLIAPSSLASLSAAHAEPHVTIGLKIGQKLEIPVEDLAKARVGLGYVSHQIYDTEQSGARTIAISWNLVSVEKAGLFGRRQEVVIHSDYEEPADIIVSSRREVSFKPKIRPNLPTISAIRDLSNSSVTLQIKKGPPHVLMAVMISNMKTVQ